MKPNRQVYHLPRSSRPPGKKEQPPARETVHQFQLDHLRKYASRMSWTADQLDRRIRQTSEGRCEGLRFIRTAAQAHYLIELIEFFFETRTQDYLARQRAMKKC